MLLLLLKGPRHMIKRTGCTVIGDIKMGHDRDARKPDFGACEQQRRRPVSVSTQSDQRLYCSLVGKYI